MNTRYAVLPIIAGAAVAAWAQSTPVTPGQWDISVRIDSAEMPGMPAAVARMMTGRTTHVKHCITAADAARGPQDLLRSNSGCQFTRYSMAGGKLSSEMTCRQGGATTTTTSTGSFTPTSFTATGRSVTAGGPMPMTMTSTSTGRLLGPCR